MLRKYWKQGYAYEASKRMFEFGFTTLPIHRLYAETNCENRNARKLAEKLGMRLEGELRECKYFNDRWWSMCIYGMLKDEWERKTLE
jgi:RimJ/RimL family protein N-acetyltransferase